VAGNRRYNACKKLGWSEICCQVVAADEKEAFRMSLPENMQRKSINPIEEDLAFEAYRMKYGWGAIVDLASGIGRSISTQIED
jgi:ParB family transcriptional regulator, chromosome partitioning protein